MNDYTPNQEVFKAADGIQLMITMIRKQVYVKYAALKTLDYALSSTHRGSDHDSERTEQIVKMDKY